jgi:putative ABC transport system permease protein
LVLASTGVFAVMSFFVSQRTRELGLRVALGAGTAQAGGLVLRQGSGIAASGLVIGVGAGILAAQWLAHTLCGVSAAEPVIYDITSVVLGLVAMAACYAPARRAMTADPMVALRVE